MPKYQKATLLLIFGVLVLGYNNCGKVQFSNSPVASVSTTGTGGPTGPSGGNPSSPSSPSSPCTPQQAVNLRIIFIVDDSGSTRTDDNGAVVRGSSALAFINQNLSDTNLTYNYSYFAANEGSFDFASSAFTPTSTDSKPAQPFGTASQALMAVNSFVSSYNSFAENGTDYDSAFQYVQSLVTADEARNPGYNYAVIFMSDGQPTHGNTSAAALDGDVTALLSAAGAGRLTVSTLYFNSSNDADSGEASLMQSLASAGNGQYVNAVTDSGTLNLSSMIQNIISVPSGSCSQ